ncbi:hypothetical protein HXX01_05380, partial [Candidatus Nomurabacteria bacterium]|nr:hypothetical protein [Candidatus Nomurabacteria bacterium]
GDGDDLTILKQRVTSQWALTANREQQGTAFVEGNMRNINIHDIQFLGTSIDNGFSQFMHLLVLNAVSDVIIQRCSFIAFRGDGLYLGATKDGHESHNERITVKDCVFDGVNKQNRNAITIADVNGLLISNCLFTRSTKKNMPAAIDLEPNPHGYEVTRNVVIENSRFYDLGGMIGGIGLQFTTPQKNLKMPAVNFIIKGNMFDKVQQGINISHQFNSPNDSSISHNIQISNNTFSNIFNSAMLLQGLKQVRVEKNTINCSPNPIRLSETNDRGLGSNDIRFNDNIVYNGDIAINEGKRIEIGGNTLVNGWSAMFRFGPGTSSYINIHDNTILESSKNMNKLVSINGAHKFTVNTNSWKNNNVPSRFDVNDFKSKAGISH